MINRKTIWNETYNRKSICVNGAHIDVLNAINDNDGLYVVSHLEISSKFSAGQVSAKVDLTADEMELLAAHLLASANYQRSLINCVVADNAELMDAAPMAVAA